MSDTKKTTYMVKPEIKKVTVALNSTGSSVSVYVDGLYIGMVFHTASGDRFPKSFHASYTPKDCAHGCTCKAQAIAGPCQHPDKDYLMGKPASDCLNWLIQKVGLKKQHNPQFPLGFLTGQAALKVHSKARTYSPNFAEEMELEERVSPKKKRKALPAPVIEEPVVAPRKLTLDEQLSEALSDATSVVGVDSDAKEA